MGVGGFYVSQVSGGEQLLRTENVDTTVQYPLVFQYLFVDIAFRNIFMKAIIIPILPALSF